MTSGWDRGAIFYADILNEDQSLAERFYTDQELLSKCLGFLETFTINNLFYYRDQILKMNISSPILVIHLGHLQAFDDILATKLSQSSAELLILLEQAVSLLYKEIHQQEAILQIQIHSSSSPMSIRNLTSGNIGKLIRLSGIITSASSIIARPISVCIRCKDCHMERYIPVAGAFGTIQMPRQCPGQSDNTDNQYNARCSWNSYQLEGDKCQCVDQQTLKLQELPEMVPVGELPRQVILTIDRLMCSNGITPGQRVTVNGIYTISGGKKANENQDSLRAPYIRVIGIQNYEEREEVEWKEADWIAFSRQPDLYNKFAASIAPSIYGHDDIKKAIACMLFGGSPKKLPDNLRIRGDINILLLGDPGTAKSQFLKFTEKVAPISVYTSGKGSSAAGLTASVIRDAHSGEFYLEGGAMVLADGGVVCIDEFDKMDGNDRVAIHEAMEQQTISIAKAGITTILNSRTSVLAAANPKFGRYDDFRSTGENIEFGTTILSRFDTIFIVKDEHVKEKDLILAKHVLQVHQQASSSIYDNSGHFDLATMKGYIAYCRQKCAPRLTLPASQHLSQEYVKLRRLGRETGVNLGKNGNGEGVPITIRQLEAIVRIAESLAKMTLSTTAGINHVNEALRLFHASTVQAASQGHVIDGMARPDLLDQVSAAERAIKQRLPIGSSIAYAKLVKELSSWNEQILSRSIDILIQQEKLTLKKKILIRQR